MSYGVPAVPMISPGAGPIPPVPFHQPTNLFRFGEQTLWSTFLFLGGAALANSVNRTFTTPLGQVGQGFANALTIGETNLKEGGRVPAGVAYDVFGLGAQVLHGNQALAGAGLTLSQPADTPAEIGDIQNIINNGVLSWNFISTVIDIAPLSLIGAGGGVYGAVSQNAAGANTGAMNNGNGSIWMYRKHPVALPGNSTFSLVVRFGSRAAVVGANCVALRIVLFGYYKNVIEIG